MPIQDRLIGFDTDRGRASFRAQHLAVPDYGTFENSIASPSTQDPPTPSHVSFDMRWKGGGKRTSVRDETYDFVGAFVEGDITIDFTAKHDREDVVYRSTGGPQHLVSGGVGRERNGVFFG